MQFNVIDTDSAYRRMLAEPDPAAREQIFRDELVKPFEGIVKVFGGGDPVAMFSQWVYGPDSVSSEADTIRSILDRLAAYDAQNKAVQALEAAREAFAPYLERVPFDSVQFGIFPYDIKKSVPTDRGYSGFGAIPGYVMTVYSDPNDYNLPRLQGATVHEFNHNVRFAVQPFNPMVVTVGEYIVAEGLAESFAAELYGEDLIGYYVTDFDESTLDIAKRVIGGALNVTGFDTVRGYIFGDVISQHMGREPMGVPNFAGYATGYHAVQQYLKRTGKSVAEATFVPSADILAQSGYFA
jgi:uncharacterized protein YjaZ